MYIRRIISAVILGLSSTLLAFSSVHALPNANFTATDGQIVGNGKSYYSTTYATELTNVSADVTDVVYYLNGKPQTTNATASNHWQDLFNVTNLPNGTYHLSATVYNAKDQSSTVTALDGNNYLTFYVKNAPSAKFTATDNGLFGNAQPGYPETFGTELTNVSPDVVQIVYYLNGVEVAVNNNSGNTGYSVDVSSLPNGVYHLTATVQDSSGDIGKVMAEDGNDNLTFTVQNSSSTSTTSSNGNTPTSSPQTCVSKQQDLNIITTQIVKTGESQLTAVDSVAKSVEHYYEKQAKPIHNYAQILSQLTKDDNNAQNAIINMVSDSVVNCNESLPSQINNFVNSTTAVQNSINSYITDTQSLITQLEAQ